MRSFCCHHHIIASWLYLQQHVPVPSNSPFILILRHFDNHITLLKEVPKEGVLNESSHTFPSGIWHGPRQNHQSHVHANKAMALSWLRQVRNSALFSAAVGFKKLWCLLIYGLLIIPETCHPLMDAYTVVVVRVQPEKKKSFLFSSLSSLSL